MITPYIISRTKKNEGLRLEVYICPKGFPTIGYGHKLKKDESFIDGITEDQANSMILADLEIADSDVHKLIENIDTLCESRQACLIDMAFNMGYSKLSAFHDMIGFLKDEKFTAAAYEIRNSLYFSEFKDMGSKRAEDNWSMMVTGVTI
jgi:lysozyme